MPTLKDCEIGDLVTLEFTVQEKKTGGYTDSSSGQLRDTVYLKHEQSVPGTYSFSSATIIKSRRTNFKIHDKVKSKASYSSGNGKIVHIVGDRAWVEWEGYARTGARHSVLLLENLEKVKI